MINCSPCYKKIIDTYAPNTGTFLNKIYHIKSAKYETYLVSDINGYTYMDFDNVFLTSQKNDTRTIWSVIPQGTSMSSYLDINNGKFNLKKISLSNDNLINDIYNVYQQQHQFQLC